MQNSRPIVPLFKTSRNALRSERERERERERVRNDHSLARAAHHCNIHCTEQYKGIGIPVTKALFTLFQFLQFSSFPARKTGKGACFSFRVHTSPVFQFSSFSFVTSLFQFSQPECELENGKTGKRAPVFQFSQIESFLFPSRKTYRDSTSPSL